MFNTQSAYLRHATSYTQSNIDVIKPNSNYDQSIDNREPSQQSKHTISTVLPNTGDSNHSDVIALLIAITGITLLYSRKNSDNIKKVMRQYCMSHDLLITIFIPLESL